MDLRVPTDRTTSVGRGQYNPEKKYLGLYYITATSNNGSGKSGRHAHSSVQCGYCVATKEYQRIPVFEVEGKAYWIDKNSQRHNDQKVQVNICPHCPEYMDNKWMKEAACAGSEDPRPFMTNKYSQTRAFIEEVCSTCPVIVDCFEYGVGTDSIGVWGGTNFSMADETSSTRRREKIKKRRKELGLS